MTAQEEPADAVDPCLVLGDVAVLMADPDTDGALEVLREGLGLDSVALYDAHGALLAGTATGSGPSLELPVDGRGGAQVGVLLVHGAQPSHLAVLRSAAAVMGLALGTAEDEAVEAERGAIADALHDGPVQSLVVARYAVDAAVRGGDPGAAREAVQSAVQELRRFLWHLRPRGSAGFVDAVEQLGAQLVEAGGPRVGLVGDARAAGALRGPAAVTAYRLVQSVARHDAPPVRVTVRTDSDRLVVDVDGGAPLTDPDDWARRVQAHGGRLTQTPAGRTRLVLPDPETTRSES